LTFTERILPLKGDITGASNAGSPRALLVLDREFTNYKHIMYMGDHYVYELGDMFNTAAEDVAHALFAEVVVGQSDNPPANVDLIVVPRVAAVRMSAFSWTQFEKVVTTVSIEWTIREANGRTVWLDTLDGEASSVVGTISSRNQLAIQRLRSASTLAFQNAMIRIREAPEMQRWFSNAPTGVGR